MPSRKSSSDTVRAVVYDRVSVDDAQSQDEHLTRCRAYAEAKGWIVVAEESETVSGFDRSKRRPAWERVEQMVDAGEVDAVIVYALSRAGRNAPRVLAFVEKCRDAGVTFASVTEDVNSAGPMGRVLLAILASLAELESATKSERARMGRDVAKRNGTWTGGRRRFGLDVDEQNRVRLNDHEAKLMRDAATDLLNGTSLRAIAHRWNDAGVLTTGGKPWSPSHVRALFTRDDAVLTDSDRRRLVALFDSRATGKSPERYMLSGLVRCGEHGDKLTGRASKYLCTHGGPKGRSVHLTVATHALDDLVLRLVREHVEEVGPFEPVEARDPSDDLVRERERIVAEQRDLGRRFRKLPAAVLDGMAEELAEELAAIDEQLDAAKPAQRAGFFDTYTDDATYVRQHVERIEVGPAIKRGEPKLNPERVTIVWSA